MKIKIPILVYFWIIFISSIPLIAQNLQIPDSIKVLQLNEQRIQPFNNFNLELSPLPQLPQDLELYQLKMLTSKLFMRENFIEKDTLIKYQSLQAFLNRQYSEEYKKMMKYDLGVITTYLGISQKIFAIIIALLSVL
ncbi:hypothetical protein APF79_12405 [bacterium BRH_c32]|nr:MAG: hypothetical protein APF79_12405 [bacterium BRH_c32]